MDAWFPAPPLPSKGDGTATSRWVQLHGIVGTTGPALGDEIAEWLA